MIAGTIAVYFIVVIALGEVGARRLLPSFLYLAAEGEFPSEALGLPWGGGQALVGEPDILLLDEPTNHLDIPAIEWLENTLQGYPGAIIFITHDAGCW